MSLIEIRNLQHTYMQGTPFANQALGGIDLDVAEGEFLGIIGPVGSGKSTLIQHINGLIKSPPGTVFVDGMDVGAPQADLQSIRRQVGLVFQYPEHQLFADTVFADVAFGPQNLGLSPDQVQERVREGLAAVELSFADLKDRSPFTLSGGQKRRAAMAGVLAMRPRVLILDEPAAGLDPGGRMEILGLVQRLRDAGGLTVLLVSHHMDDIARLADRVAVLHQGRVALHGTPRSVFDQGGFLREIGLAPPDIREFMGLLAAGGLPVPTDVLTLGEARAAIMTALAERRPPGGEACGH